MPRFIPPHPRKGSPEAKAWAVKMKKARIRAAGKRTEQQYFGPRGEVQTSIYSQIQKRRREHPEHFIDGIPRTNPKGFHNIEKSGFHRGEYVGYGGGTWKIKKYGTGARLWIAVKQGGGGEFYGSSFSDLSAKLDALAQKKNPGEAWHRGMETTARRYSGAATEKLEKALFKGVEVAHHDSALVARKMGMNRTRERKIPAPRRRTRKNPLAVFGLGNPPKKINACIAGVIYSRCLEIRAEKLKYKPGLYRHPFSRKSGVQVLALDNGDLLVHSTRGVNLWEPI